MVGVFRSSKATAVGLEEALEELVMRKNIICDYATRWVQNPLVVSDV